MSTALARIMPVAGRAQSLADAADALEAACDAAQRWSVAQSLARDFGASSLVVTHFPNGAYLPAWARTDMSSEWRQAYWGQQLYRSDPLLQCRMLGATPEILQSKPIAESTHLHPGVIAWGRLLVDAGYLTLMPRVFDDPENGGQKVVSVLTDRQNAELPDDVTLNALLALIGSHVGPPTADEPDLVAVSERNALTGRERDVLCLLADGLTTGRIAERLGLAEVTVHKHFRRAREKMGAATREQALALAMVRGQLHL